MNLKNKKLLRVSLDLYTIRARLKPTLIVALPLGVAAFAWFPDNLTTWSLLWGMIVWSGGIMLSAQIGRDRGKQKENDLFNIWGGKPTTRMLQHRFASNKVILARQHKTLQRLIPNIKIPTPKNEGSNPYSADEIYDACTSFLREKTRDRKKFPLVFEENCNYGFRRNLWGMKPLGMAISLISVFSLLILIFLDYFINNVSVPPVVFVCGAIIIFYLLMWAFLINPNWVKVAAYAYAERLLSSCENL
jgi:hypothetical protein